MDGRLCHPIHAQWIDHSGGSGSSNADSHDSEIIQDINKASSETMA